MDQESQERFRKIEEILLKFAANDLVLLQHMDRLDRQSEDQKILLDQLLKSQMRLEESKERHEVMIAELRAMNAELKAGNEESRRREFRLEDIAVDHQRVLRTHEKRLSQIENAA